MTKKSIGVIKMALAIVLVAGVLFFSPSLKMRAYTVTDLIVKGALAPGVTEPTNAELEDYRPLVDSDVGKVFGVDLETKIYFDYTWEGASSNTLLADWVVPDTSYVLELKVGSSLHQGNDDYKKDVYLTGGFLSNDVLIVELFDNFDEGTEWEVFHIVSYSLPNNSYIDNIYYSTVKDLILVKEIALSDYELGYNAGFLTGSGVGYLEGYNNGHEVGFQQGYTEAMEELGSQEGGLYWLTSVLTSVGSILAIEIFPSISIGILIFIPFAFGLLFWFLKLLKGGGD